MQRDIALNAPMNDRMLVHVFGGSADINGVILCGVTVRVPDVHFQPRTVKLFGPTKVLTADRESPFLFILSKTISQRRSSLSKTLLQMYISSAIMRSHPSVISLPKILDISSCKSSEDPGIPITGVVYTRKPLYGVMVAK